ncbi:isoprenylcysteine carboxylmethyltransferase family protein [Thalassotalea litorea]|uniref:Isoprenylcysteine carboxylmethyltransferase family protein n=1 Tax=Thalassotalea litorea TaxID=2020715 RepID=A0A5R9ITZ5_9GAMM|nr:isoprenylcysteine carboxylmethyltransferase family protein [Thalassotalea litorea]TLU67577.1 isoprenylcysteine carboxylmethyltransferase family protein [Thalassotalea litorea]
MKFLELKIPPLLLLIAFMAGAWLLRAPNAPLIAINFHNMLAVIVGLIGLLAIMLGVFHFHQKKTSVDPRFPDQTSSLVAHGIYRFSRNPMYLGFALILTGWCVFLASLSAALLVPVFMFYLDRWQIQPEERILESIFKQEYLAYKARVRRWL